MCSSVRLQQIPDGGSTASVRSILTSLGQLKFRPDVLLDSIAQWMVERKDSLVTKDLTTFLVTAATLNHRSTFAEPLFKVKKEQVSRRWY